MGVGRITLAIQALVSLVVFTPPGSGTGRARRKSACSERGGRSPPRSSTSARPSVRCCPAARSAGIGPMRMSQSACCCAAAGMALMATANVAWSSLGALVIGLGYGQVTPSSSAILAERAPPHLRAFIFSLKQTGVPIGGALAGALLPALIWRFGLEGRSAGDQCHVPGARSRAATDAHARSTRAAARPTPAAGSDWRARCGSCCRIRRLREMALASFTYSGMQMCLGSFLVVFLHDRVRVRRLGCGGRGAVHRDDRRHRRAASSGEWRGQLGQAPGAARLCSAARCRSLRSRWPR